MKDHFGGYLYVPVKEYTLEEVVNTIFQQLGGEKREFLFYMPGEKAQMLPRGEIWKKQQQVGPGKGSIELELGGTEAVITMWVRFQPSSEDYHLVRIDTEGWQISYLTDLVDKANAELLAQRWLTCCKILHVDFAYFSKSEVLLEPRCRDDYLTYLRESNLDKLLEELVINWLMYLGPILGTQAVIEAFERAQQRDHQLLQHVEPQVLESGAVFLRTGQDASLAPDDESDE